jgi:hypothetical protein
MSRSWMAEQAWRHRDVDGLGQTDIDVERLVSGNRIDGSMAISAECTEWGGRFAGLHRARLGLPTRPKSHPSSRYLHDRGCGSGKPRCR